MTPRGLLQRLCAGLLALSGCAASTLPGSVQAPENVLVRTLDSLVWTESRPNGEGSEPLRSADLWGNRERGAHRTLTLFPAGFVEPLHRHSRSFRILVVDGAMRFVIGEREESPELMQGSFIVIPGRMAHRGRCVASGGCKVYVEQDGPMDIEVLRATPAPSLRSNE